MNKILIVDDDDEIRELLEFDLSKSGYSTTVANNGLDGLNIALNNDFDIVLLDVMMPKMNGFQVCHNIKMVKPDLPILLLTAKGTIQDKTQGFNLGADDYLVKPFDIQEVLLRIRALLRRSSSHKNNLENQLSSKEILKGDQIELFQDSLEVKVIDQQIKLTPTEFEILYCLFQHANKAVSLATILSEVWGYDSDEDVRMLRVHMGTLRQKIEQDPKNPHFIHTVTNVGYKLTLHKV